MTRLNVRNFNINTDRTHITIYKAAQCYRKLSGFISGFTYIYVSVPHKSVLINICKVISNPFLSFGDCRFWFFVINLYCFSRKTEMFKKRDHRILDSKVSGNKSSLPKTAFMWRGNKKGIISILYSMFCNSDLLFRLTFSLPLICNINLHCFRNRLKLFVFLVNEYSSAMATSTVMFNKQYGRV